MLCISAAYSPHFADHTNCNLVGGTVTISKDPAGIYRQESIAARAQEAVSECLPEVDDEVLVAYEQGDLRRPCLIGSLWNSGDKSPAASDAGSAINQSRRSR